MKTHKEKYIYHTIGCLGFILIPLLLSPRPPEEDDGFFTLPTIRDLIANILMLAFFYINYYVSIPKLYFAGKYFNYFVLVAISFLLIIILPSTLTGIDFMTDAHRPDDLHVGAIGGGVPMKPDNPFLQEIRHHIYLFCVVTLFSILLRVNRRLHQSEKDRAEAELSNLKAQIHPHFLFNTLNSIYALAVTKDDKAPDSIVKLSEFMRYLLTDAGKNQVVLYKEIEYISNYLDLQRSRLRDSVRINFQLSGEASADVRIAPLLLFSFIENAFKHGVNPEEDSQIDIHIAVSDTSVEMMVRNNKVNVVKKEQSLGVGLSNSSQRLARLYPESYKLEIENNPEYFQVNLLIELP